MKKALINIDYSNDFVASDGALTCGEPAQKIERRITALSEEFLANGELVVLANDAHDYTNTYHPETRLFPPHNIVGSHGQQIYGMLGAFYEANKTNPLVHYVPKTHYSAFCGTDLLLTLRERKIDEVHLTGVCTDICVLHTAIDAYNLGFNIVIHKDAVASFDPVGHAWALKHFATCLGASVVE